MLRFEVSTHMEIHMVRFLVITPYNLVQWYSTWDKRTLGGKRKHLTPIKTKQRNSLNLKSALILALTKICPRTEVLACQKQSSN
jgi:hypothetical protein